MIYLLLTILALECSALIIWGLRKKGRIYEFPFLAAAVFGGFVLVQLIGHSRNPDLPEGAVEKVALMAILCVAMLFVGYSYGGKKSDSKAVEYDQLSLTRGAAILTFVGAYFFYLIGLLPKEMTDAALWTGLPVAYLFFANLMSYGFALAVLIFLRTKSKTALILAMIATVFYLDRILIGGRRGVTLEFLFVIICGAWFQKKWLMPRALMLVGLFVATLALFSTGEYRHAVHKETPEWGQITQIDFITNFRKQLSEGGPELKNTIYITDGVDKAQTFDYGVFHWNTLINNFVPAQLVGPDFKESMMVHLDDAAYHVHGYKVSPGITSTGMADAFTSFWYFGCLKFLLIGYVMRQIYVKARKGEMYFQALYCVLLAHSLQSITHNTHWLVSSYIHVFVFLAPIFALSRRRKSKTTTPLENVSPLRTVT